MKTYKATILASYAMEIEVYADSPEEAKQTMHAAWNPFEADCEYFEIHELIETDQKVTA
jgi:hypothetical protein